MRTFIVSHHHVLGPNPLLNQGVLLVPEMFGKGIWCGRGGSMNSTDRLITEERTIERLDSETERDMFAGLQGLLEAMPPDADAHLAVVSLVWSQERHMLMLPKRTWIHVYHGEDRVVAYTHRDNGSPTYHFTQLAGVDPITAAYWKERFEKDIRAHWERQRDSAAAQVESGESRRSKATAVLSAAA